MSNAFADHIHWTVGTYSVLCVPNEMFIIFGPTPYDIKGLVFNVDIRVSGICVICGIR